MRDALPPEAETPRAAEVSVKWRVTCPLCGTQWTVTDAMLRVDVSWAICPDCHPSPAGPPVAPTIPHSN